MKPIINDLIKSLVVQDARGKSVPMRYDSQEPIEKTLKSFGVDLTSDPSLAKLLGQIRGEIERGEFAWQLALEDVHLNVEKRLTELIGDAGKRLHTGRSRNDQVATDIRLYLRSEVGQIEQQLTRLQTAILNLAEQHAGTIMPGFTHLQVAQPITFGHHLMAWFEMLQRDRDRFQDCLKRINIMPLGAAALAIARLSRTESLAADTAAEPKCSGSANADRFILPKLTPSR